MDNKIHATVQDDVLLFDSKKTSMPMRFGWVDKRHEMADVHATVPREKDNLELELRILIVL